MMINRRRVCGGKSLPYDYEVEYLNGRIIADVDISSLDFVIESDHVVQFGYVSQNVGDNTWIAIEYNPSKTRFNCWYRIYHQGYTNTNVLLSDAITYNSKEGVYINGVLKKSFVVGSATPSIANIPLYIGTRYDFSKRGPEGNSYIYKTKIYESSVLKRDFIPVVKDGIGYMYDKVSKTLFSYAGDGTFNEIGPRVS